MSTPIYYPTNVGYTPTGSAYGSQLYLGRNLATTWEAIGFGQVGRPDILERVYINLTQVSGVATPTRVAQLSFNVADVQTIITANPNAAAAALTFQLREVDVCESSVAKKMLVLCSAPYTA